ncbi:DUF488 domain-containing protein [Salegentibacter chungangensis]|uniref:DUF488 domain-containing protein n=1 Tax=Salegentibacter chungangensis TaxID=1335724 RepID=A0ABW3NR50_9FLAO
MKDIKIKRLYDHKSADGSYRILVDRLWPRGVKKTDLEFDEWNKDLAPSTELRKRFNHKPELFEGFTKEYKTELEAKTEELNRIREIAATKDVSLLYGSRDPENNHAAVLKQVLTKK